MTFDSENSKQAIRPYYWVAIEGIRKRFGTYQPSWNPADSGTNRYINTLLARVPKIGGQIARPLDGKCSIPSHSFTLVDEDDEITQLISVSDTPFNKTYLTRAIDSDDTGITVENTAGFPSSGHLYLDRETVYYSGKSNVSKLAQTASGGLTGQTANGGSKFTISDVARTEDDNYWIGATLEVTAGTNVGEIRTIRSYYYDTDSSRGIIAWDSPMPSACDATTVYSITMPPDRIKCAGLTEANGYWNGATIQITSGTNAGLVAWVQTFTSADDTCELVTPLPESCDATTTFNIYLEKFTGCTRGLYGSEAKPHVITTEDGTLTRRRVSDKLPFMKTRMVEIFENRDGCDEDQAIRTLGYIDDYMLDNDGNCYSFSCSGMLKLLSRKLMSDPPKTRINKLPLWGGFFQTRAKGGWTSVTIGGSTYSEYGLIFKFGFIMEDGRGDGFTVNKIWISGKGSSGFPSDGGNIKIDDEIIHYTSRESSSRYSWTYDMFLRLGDTEVELDVDENGDQIGTLVVEDTEAYHLACYSNRSLFSEKIGVDHIKRQATLAISTQNLLNELRWMGTETPEPLDVKAFMQEHNVGAEVTRVCICDDSPKSDFPRYDFIEYSSLAGGSFAAGDTITGGSSGTTATVMETTEDGTEGTLLVAFASPHYNSFSVTETISCGGVSATVDVYRKEVRPRNNVIDVFLQLVTSTGTAASNGQYDTLPDGFGLEIDQDFVDIDSIEALRDKWFATLPVEFVLHEPTSAIEWMKKNIFLPAQVFPFETYEGKIGLGCLMTDAEARADNEDSSATEFDANHMDSKQIPDWTSGKPPISKIVMSYNKHPVNDDYMGKIEMIFGDSKEWYQDLGRSVELSIDSFYYRDSNFEKLRHNDPRMPSILRRLTAVIWDRQSLYPCPVINCRTPYSDVKNNIGDIVLVTHLSLPNLRTSQRGLSGEYYQIVGRQPDPKNGAMIWTLWQIGVHDMKFARRAPSAQIDTFTPNVPVGKATIVLKPRVFSRIGTQDIESFSVGMKICAVSNLTYAHLVGYEDWEIESITVATNTIILTSNPTNPPAANYFLEYAQFDDCASGQQEGRIFMADENHLLGGVNDSAFKYL